MLASMAIAEALVAVLDIWAADETDQGSERRIGGRKDHRQS